MTATLHLHLPPAVADQLAEVAATRGMDAEALVAAWEPA